MQHVPITEALMTIAGIIRSTATILAVLVATKSPKPIRVRPWASPLADGREPLPNPMRGAFPFRHYYDGNWVGGVAARVQRRGGPDTNPAPPNPQRNNPGATSDSDDTAAEDGVLFKIAHLHSV